MKEVYLALIRALKSNNKGEFQGFSQCECLPCGPELIVLVGRWLHWRAVPARPLFQFGWAART